jgi:hypothetical protein
LNASAEGIVAGAATDGEPYQQADKEVETDEEPQPRGKQEPKASTIHVGSISSLTALGCASPTILNGTTYLYEAQRPTPLLLTPSP